MLDDVVKKVLKVESPGWFRACEVIFLSCLPYLLTVLGSWQSFYIAMREFPPKLTVLYSSYAVEDPMVVESKSVGCWGVSLEAIN